MIVNGKKVDLPAMSRQTHIFGRMTGVSQAEQIPAGPIHVADRSDSDRLMHLSNCSRIGIPLYFEVDS